METVPASEAGDPSLCEVCDAYALLGVFLWCWARSALSALGDQASRSRSQRAARRTNGASSAQPEAAL